MIGASPCSWAIFQTDCRKENKKEEKGVLESDDVWTMCKIVKREKKYKRKAIITWLKPWGCKAITCFSYKPNLCVLLCSKLNQREKETEKEERLEHPKAKCPTKIPPHKSPIDPWWLHILSMIWWEMTCKVDLWHVYGLELGWNTCLCEILYTLSSFPLFGWTQCFF